MTVSISVVNLFHFHFTGVSLGDFEEWYESLGLLWDGVLLQLCGGRGGIVVCKYPTPGRWALDGGLF